MIYFRIWSAPMLLEKRKLDFQMGWITEWVNIRSLFLSTDLLVVTKRTKRRKRKTPKIYFPRRSTVRSSLLYHFFIVLIDAFVDSPLSFCCSIVAFLLGRVLFSSISRERRIDRRLFPFFSFGKNNTVFFLDWHHLSSLRVLAFAISSILSLKEKNG